MKKIYLFLLQIVITIPAFSQDTFSIVAVDSVTGEVGSAGASCVPIALPNFPHGAVVISDVIPAVGAINTQAYYVALNQQNAHAHLLAGDSAQQVIDWLSLNDAQGNAAIRQYGVVEYNNGHPRSAGFTGANCMTYKNHITGPGYSIQGNILLGQQILDSMEARFLNTTGTLADRLMAALQGANVVGADTRCAPQGLSSLSSFIRVALPTDSANNIHLDLYMAYPNQTSWPIDPIDSLQTLYNSWLAGIHEVPHSFSVTVTPVANGYLFDFSSITQVSGLILQLYDIQGKNILTKVPDQTYKLNGKEHNLSKGIYIYRVFNGDEIIASGKIAF
jgi:uncharacterized Ntn-hydrolase superfamily protein